MANYSLYYVPLTSLTTQTDTFPNLDTTTSSRIGNTIVLNGPTTVIHVEDTSNDGVLNDDLNFGSQKLTQAGGGFPAGSGIEHNYYYDVQGSDGSVFTIFVVAIGSSAVADTVTGIVSQKPLVPGVTYKITGYNSLYDVPYSSLVCFATGTRILCETGEHTVEEITEGTRVFTRDNGVQTVRWIGCRDLSSAQLLRYENLRPIVISAGALGPNMPNRDLRVSPQHRVLVRSKIADRMFGTVEVLVAAKQLLEMPGIYRDDSLAPVGYFHMLFDRHEIIWSEGAETESLYTGPQALKSIGEESLAEIRTLFPELFTEEFQTPPSARTLVKGREGRQLAARHVKNNKDLVAAPPTKV